MAAYMTIPMEDFPLRGRFNPQLLPPTHLAQAEVLDAKSSFRLLEMTSPWVSHRPPFAHAHFSNIATMPIPGYAADEIHQMKTWLYQRGISSRKRVFLSWDNYTAAITTWKMVVRY
jgi:hypothetical protein